MPRLSRMVCYLAGGAVFMAPLLASGHACEFLFARLDVQAGGKMRLEMTADYGANPLIPDEAAARTALADLLQLTASDQAFNLSELAPLHFEKRSQCDASTPAAFSPPSDGAVHQLLTATWQWQSGADSVVLTVPKGSPNDVLLWTSHLKATDGGPKWMLLIEGESSPPISLMQTSQSTTSAYIFTFLLGLLTIVGWGLLKISRAPAGR